MPDEKEKTPSSKDVTKESKKDEDQADDFKYIVRIANSDMPGDKGVVFALTAIKGIGDRVAEVIINKTKGPRLASLILIAGKNNIIKLLASIK